MGSALKKTLHAAEQDRSDVAAARQEWSEKQPTLEISRLVFIDETWASTSMTRLRGRSKVGQRLIGKTPHGHWKTTTFVAALRCDGVTAPFVIDKAMTGEIFLAYVRQFLLPTLRKGDIVIMDNLPAHKVDGIAEAIESVEARVQYLPSYSPDLNPIERLFAKLKALLRKAKTRSIDALWQCIGELLDTVSVKECLNYFKHDGYGAA
jgi:transposase